MEKNHMNSMKIIGAAALLSAAIATPVLAQDVGTNARHSARHQQTFYRSADPIFAAPPQSSEEYRNLEDFGMSGRSPSRVGGDDPNLNPPS
jgi:hypothetical protein